MAGRGEGVGLVPAWLRFAEERLACFVKVIAPAFCRLATLWCPPNGGGVFTRKSPFYYVSERFYRSRLGQEGDFLAGFGFRTSGICAWLSSQG